MTDLAGTTDNPEVRGSPLQEDLAGRILRLLKDQGVGRGHHLVELDLCRHFQVSRTPIRGALQLLAQKGAVESRARRGFVLCGPVTATPAPDTTPAADEKDNRLFVAIATARNRGELPDHFSQLELSRKFEAPIPRVVRVLLQLAGLGLVERKPGNGWAFTMPVNSSRTRKESYAFRRFVEPAGLVEPTFDLDRDWLEISRARHLAFRKRRWRQDLAVDFFALNLDFHEQLARCSGNRYIIDAVQRQNRLRSFLNINWVNGAERVTDSIDEHLAVLDAVGVGDNAVAATLLKEHIDRARSVQATV